MSVKHSMSPWFKPGLVLVLLPLFAMVSDDKGKYRLYGERFISIIEGKIIYGDIDNVTIQDPSRGLLYDGDVDGLAGDVDRPTLLTPYRIGCEEICGVPPDKLKDIFNIAKYWATAAAFGLIIPIIAFLISSRLNLVEPMLPAVEDAGGRRRREDSGAG